MRNKLISSLLLIFTGLFSVSAQTWSPVGTSVSGASVPIYTLCADDSVLYAGGMIDSAGGVRALDIAQWNGTIWDSTGICNGQINFINAIAEYNGNLYVGGSFSSIGGVAASNIAVWNGSNWMPLGKGISYTTAGVEALAVYNGALYVGGGFDSAGGMAISGIAKWDGTNWSAVGAGFNVIDEDAGVRAFAVYGGDLYMGGDFIFAGNTNFAKWDGTTLSIAGEGVTGNIYALAVYNNQLYVGGMMTRVGAYISNSLAIFTNTGVYGTWSNADSGIWGENEYAEVNALTVYNTELYAGGYFDTVGGKTIKAIAKWNGKRWASVVSGNITGYGFIQAMAVYNGALYVAGGFDSIGGVYANNIAMMKNNESSVQDITENNSVSVYPNPGNSNITIQMSHVTDGMFYTIYNELGQPIETGIIATSQSTQINVSNYINGIYCVVVTDGTRQYTAKFIKN